MTTSALVSATAAYKRPLAIRSASVGPSTNSRINAHAVAVLESVNRADMGMIQRREHARFAIEPCVAVGFREPRFGEDFDRDIASEIRVARAIHFTHATGADERDDFVGAYPSARRELHASFEIVSPAVRQPPAWPRREQDR
jgi:hypothetical protein